MSDTKLSDQDRAQRIVERMMSHDGFSRWLGVVVKEIAPGRAVIEMKIRDEMLNGFGTCHGGIQYSLADSALAFASNGRGRKSVALENVISYPAPVVTGDVLTAHAEEVSLGNTIGTYDITVFNQHKRKVALFRGSVYRLREEWEV